MNKNKVIHIACFFVFILLFSPSCRTASVSPAWGLCGYEDPVNECEWMRKIIQKNRTKGMIIEEVVTEKYILIRETDSVYYEKTGELMYAYQITCELTGIFKYDLFDTDSYDCNGQYLNSGYGVGSPIFYSESGQFFTGKIIDLNIIYEQ